MSRSAFVALSALRKVRRPRQVRDTLLRVNDLAGKESDARCLEFDAALSLIAESDAAEMELTFAATGV